MKTHIKIGMFCGIILMLFSCEKKYNKEDIIRLLNSNDKTEIMKGCSLLKDEKDTVFVKYLFKNIEDGRISHNTEFYGITVHQATIGALRRISGINPPNKSTYKLDSLNTAFYKDWAVKKDSSNNGNI